MAEVPGTVKELPVSVDEVPVSVDEVPSPGIGGDHRGRGAAPRGGDGAHPGAVSDAGRGLLYRGGARAGAAGRGGAGARRVVRVGERRPRQSRRTGYGGCSGGRSAWPCQQPLPAQRGHLRHRRGCVAHRSAARSRSRFRAVAPRSPLSLLAFASRVRVPLRSLAGDGLAIALAPRQSRSRSTPPTPRRPSSPGTALPAWPVRAPR